MFSGLEMKVELNRELFSMASLNSQIPLNYYVGFRV
jgi:hypothetical protein